MKFWTKSPGAGGRIKKEEDFVVEEIISRKFLPRFTRTGSGVSHISGPYTLALLKKQGVTTEDALRFVISRLNLNREDIGYAGLKDKFGVTSQYITIKGAVEDFKTERIELRKIGLTNKMMGIGELEANKFTITLHGCNPRHAMAAVDELEKHGMPNYFGPQRFGLYGNENIGKLLLQRKFMEALGLINRQAKNRFKDLRGVEKRKLKFFINAYQSSVFNQVLDKYISCSTKPFLGSFAIAGYNTKLKGDFSGKETGKILERDNITLKDFSVRELNLNATGSLRRAFVKTGKISRKAKGNSVTLGFELPKWSYATILIREVAKN